MAGKKPARKAVTRQKVAVVVDRHAQSCTVCKHPQKAELEALYMRFEPVSELVSEFEVQERAIYRHVRYYELSRKRAADTEKVLEAIVQKGAETLSLLPIVDLKLAVEAIKELHKVRGKIQEPMPNQNLTEDQKAERAAELLNRGKERMKLVKSK
jgi:hypothetical protein